MEQPSPLLQRIHELEQEVNRLRELLDQAGVAHLHTRLQTAGIHLNTSGSLHQHFAIIDRSIVWYGNANILSRDKADTHIIRITSPEVASELLSNCTSPETGAQQLSLF